MSHSVHSHSCIREQHNHRTIYHHGDERPVFNRTPHASLQRQHIPSLYPKSIQSTAQQRSEDNYQSQLGFHRKPLSPPSFSYTQVSSAHLSAVLLSVQMATREQTSSPVMPSCSGTKAGKKSNARNKNQAKATSKVPASPDVESQFEEPSVQPSPLESECEGKDEIQQTSSRSGDQSETLSFGAAHSRKRSHSLPNQSPVASHCDSECASAGSKTANDSQTRIKAISLLRARTLSRSHDSGQLSQEFLQSVLESKSFVSVEESPGSTSEGTMAFMKASLLDFMSDTPKKNKSKGKKKGKNVPVGEPLKSPKALAKNDTESNVPVEEEAGGSSKAFVKDNSVEFPLRGEGIFPKQDGDEACLTTEEPLINAQPSDNSGKGKGKQRAEVLELEASNNNGTLSTLELSSVQMKPHSGNTSNGGPETPSSHDAALPSAQHSPEQESTDASKAVTEEVNNASKKDKSLPSCAPLPVQKKPEVGNALNQKPKTSTETKRLKTSTSLSELAKTSTLEPSPTQTSADASKAVAEEPKTPTGIKDSNSKPSISPAGQSSLKHTSPRKKKLPAIKEGEYQHDSVPESGTESPVLRASTPRSTGTDSNSTAWTPSAPASTPQTTIAASAPSTDQRTKDKGKGKGRAPSILTGPASSGSVSASSFQVISNHAHPSPSTSTSSRTTTDIHYRSRGRITSKKTPIIFWQLDSLGFPCAKTGCPARCNLWDEATVICPKCGPYSETRYCSRAHLLQDIKVHWPICGQAVFAHPCRDSTIPRDVREAPPLIPCLYGFDTPERHRQAVHFNMNHCEGDYFIFSDWVDMVNKGALKKSDTDKEKVKLRCSSTIIHVVRLEDAQERDRFRRVLAAVLFVTIENPPLTDYLYRLIRDHIRSTTTESPGNPLLSLEFSLKYQMNKEFAITIQPYITGKRHACPTDWTGRSRRSCTDEVCRSEYRPLFGQRSGGGHKTRIEELESSYWILRAARITHPTAQNAMERMTGKGFMEEDGHFGVEEYDRRVFCRGDGWDGAGAGDMEIEGLTC